MNVFQLGLLLLITACSAPQTKSEFRKHDNLTRIDFTMKDASWAEVVARLKNYSNQCMRAYQKHSPGRMGVAPSTWTVPHVSTWEEEKDRIALYVQRDFDSFGYPDKGAYLFYTEVIRTPNNVFKGSSSYFDEFQLRGKSFSETSIQWVTGGKKTCPDLEP